MNAVCIFASILLLLSTCPVAHRETRELLNAWGKWQTLLNLRIKEREGILIKMAEWIHPLITLLRATFLGMMTIKRENKDTANLKNKMDLYTKKQTIDATQRAGTQPRVCLLCPAVCLPLWENRNWKCYLLGVGEASLCDAKGSGKAFRTHERRTNLLPVHCSDCYGPHRQKDRSRTLKPNAEPGCCVNTFNVKSFQLPTSLFQFWVSFFSFFLRFLKIILN